MNTRTVSLLLAAALAAAGCARGTSPAAAPSLPLASEGFSWVEGNECLTGRVGVEGPGLDPRVALARAGAPMRPLAGPLARRIRLLTGATVTACGVPSAGPGLPLWVEAFQLRQVDGYEAYLGQVRRAGDGDELAPWGGGVPIPLMGAGREAPRAPAMVWVAGRWQDEWFVVLSYGALTEW